MSRSAWKVPYVTPIIFSSGFKKFYNIIIKNKSSIISPVMVGKKIKVYNGAWWLNLNVKSNMVNFRVGEFISTKKSFKVVVEKKIKKKKK